MSKISIDYDAIKRMQDAMKNYAGNVEESINEILHNDIPPIAKESIKNLMPVSGKNWKGKSGPAKRSNSLTNMNENLALTIKTTKSYQYLYFPDDGTNTRRHVGNQRFFERGGEAITDDIVTRCINKLTNEFEEGV